MVCGTVLRVLANGRPIKVAIMEFEVTEARIAALEEEIQTIDFADKLYWSHKGHSSEATSEHNCRRERLHQIRSELRAWEAQVS
jgi:hypothetical protein